MAEKIRRSARSQSPLLIRQQKKKDAVKERIAEKQKKINMTETLKTIQVSRYPEHKQSKKTIKASKTPPKQLENKQICQQKINTNSTNDDNNATNAVETADTVTNSCFDDDDVDISLGDWKESNPKNSGVSHSLQGSQTPMISPACMFDNDAIQSISNDNNSNTNNIDLSYDSDNYIDTEMQTIDDSYYYRTRANNESNNSNSNSNSKKTKIRVNLIDSNEVYSSKSASESYLDDSNNSDLCVSVLVFASYCFYSYI